MTKYTVYSNGFRFQRVNKTQAKRAYNNGLAVIVTPVNIDPFGVCGGGLQITNKSNESFENVVNAFEFYNCINSETGRYTGFYLPVRLNEFDNRFEYDYSYLKED